MFRIHVECVKKGHCSKGIECLLYFFWGYIVVEEDSWPEILDEDEDDHDAWEAVFNKIAGVCNKFAVLRNGLIEDGGVVC